MTYGEYYYRVKYDMKLVNGNWVSKPAYMKIPVITLKNLENIGRKEK